MSLEPSQAEKILLSSIQTPTHLYNLQQKYGISSDSFFYFSDVAKPSKLSKSTKVLAALKKVGKRTGIGKAVAAATVVAGAYEAGKRKLFTKDKKKIDKKSIGGETVVMKSGGGYIDELL